MFDHSLLSDKANHNLVLQKFMTALYKYTIKCNIFIKRESKEGRVLKTLGSRDPGSRGRFHKVMKVQLLICAFYLHFVTKPNLATRLALTSPKSLKELQRASPNFPPQSWFSDKRLFQVITEVLFIRFRFKLIKILIPVIR
jgi:hypothetical protein